MVIKCGLMEKLNPKTQAARIISFRKHNRSTMNNVHVARVTTYEPRRETNYVFDACAIIIKRAIDAPLTISMLNVHFSSGTRLLGTACEWAELTNDDGTDKILSYSMARRSGHDDRCRPRKFTSTRRRLSIEIPVQCGRKRARARTYDSILNFHETRATDLANVGMRDRYSAMRNTRPAAFPSRYTARFDCRD